MLNKCERAGRGLPLTGFFFFFAGCTVCCQATVQATWADDNFPDTKRDIKGKENDIYNVSKAWISRDTGARSARLI